MADARFLSELRRNDYFFKIQYKVPPMASGGMA
jgi:hypothetical protein